LERLLISIKLDRLIDLIESNIYEVDSFTYFDILILVTVLILVYLGSGALRISCIISRLGYSEREREKERERVSIQLTTKISPTKSREKPTKQAVRITKSSIYYPKQKNRTIVYNPKKKDCPSKVPIQPSLPKKINNEKHKNSALR